MASENSKRTLLYVSHLKKYFDVTTGFLKKAGYVKALDDVTFSLKEGETVGVVGETGCGKTTLGRTVLALTEATDGDVYFNLDSELMNKLIDLEERFYELNHKREKLPTEENELAEISKELIPLRNKYSLTRLKEREIRKYRKNMQPIFQDPFSSLDPRKLVKDIVSEPLKLLTDLNNDEISEKVRKMINEIGLSDDHLFRFPHEFSGGQRQRIGIARAIGIEPKMLVLDEPTSALDVSVQAQILNMLKEIQENRKLSYLFISHHLNVIRLMSDRVIVMYLGRIAEFAETNTLFTDMLHPYTKALLSAIPSIDPTKRKGRIILEGEIPSPSDPPKGCYFHPRCPEAMKNCGWSPRDMSEPLSEALDPFSDPALSALPAISEIIEDENDNTLDIVFSTAITDQVRARELIVDALDKASKKANGIKFKAIKSVAFRTPDTLTIGMIEPDVPRLREVRKDHFVSCLIYDAGYNEHKGRKKIKKVTEENTANATENYENPDQARET